MPPSRLSSARSSTVLRAAWWTRSSSGPSRSTADGSAADPRHPFTGAEAGGRARLDRASRRNGGGRAAGCGGRRSRRRRGRNLGTSDAAHPGPARCGSRGSGPCAAGGSEGGPSGAIPQAGQSGGGAVRRAQARVESGLLGAVARDDSLQPAGFAGALVVIEDFTFARRVDLRKADAGVKGGL